MNDRWLDRSEVQSLTGWSLRTIQSKVKNGSLVSRTTERNERNGQPAREYSALSLPPEFQVKLAKRNARPLEQTAIIPAIKSEQSLIPAASMLPAVRNVSRQPVTEEQQTQIEQRFKVISPLMDYAKASKAERARTTTPNGIPFTNLEAFAKHLATENGISRTAVWDWYSRFKKQGPQGLLDKVRSDKGQSFFVKHPAAATYVKDKFLNERLSVRGTYDAFCRDWKGIAPTYETLRIFLNSLPMPIVTLAREGRRAYTDRMAPYLKRAFTDVCSNEIWVSDHVILDVEAQNDVFIDAPRGAAIRMRLTDLEDFRSRYIVGVSFAWEGSSRSIGSAMLRACATHGPCDALYCDNGKDYRKIGKGALPASLRKSPQEAEQWYQRELKSLEELGFLAHIGTSVQYCQPYHGQAKHVERFHRTLHEHFCSLFPTYTGGRPDRRPDSTTARMSLHRKLQREGTPELSDHPLASEVIRQCLQWIAEYNQQPHSGEGMNGRTPAEVFARYRNPLQRPPMDQHTLALMIAEKERRTVHECAVQLKNKRYIGCDDDAAAVLHQMNEREVIIAYDPLSLNDLAILDVDGMLLCWARQEQLLPQSPAASEAIAASMKQRRGLERDTRNELDAVAAANRQIGARSESALLAERSRHLLPMAVGDYVTQRGFKKGVGSVVVSMRVQCAEDVADELYQMDGD